MNARIGLLAAVRLLYAPAAWGATQAAAESQSEPPYGVVLYQEDFMMPVRDGVRLATDIYRPTRNGRLVEEKLPILLHRTPYNKSGQADQARNFARAGYVVVVQDTRGRYKSGGNFSKYYEYDALDGHDAVQWLSKLPYGTGKVGMWGTSYGAHTQADAAKMNPPGLATIVLTNGGTSDGWDHTIRNNGVFELGRQIAWAFGQLPGETADPVVLEMLKLETADMWLDAIPFRKGNNPLSIAPNFEDYFIRMLTHGDRKDWLGLGVNWVDYYAQTADVPMLHVGGWFDPWTGSTVDNYVGLSKIKKGPVRMLMGPWTHGGVSRSSAGDVEFGPEAAITDFAQAFHLRWFDHFLKRRRTGTERESAVRIFVMGTGDGHKTADGKLFHGGYWRDATDWPLPGAEPTTFYFHADGALRTEAPAARESMTTYTHDPANPVPTIGGPVSGAITQWSPAGPFDQREGPRFFGSKAPYLPLRARPDVPVFQTEPLAEDVEIVGPIVVRLFASSSAQDTDFMVKLVDVYPPSRDFPAGFDMNLTDRPIRARYRNGPDRPELMEPGKVYEFVIRPFPTANVFKRGHRIRVDISSSNFPRFDVNPNTGEPLGRHRRMVSADNTLHHSAQHASHIVLPVVPSRGR